MGPRVIGLVLAIYSVQKLPNKISLRAPAKHRDRYLPFQDAISRYVETVMTGWVKAADDGVGGGGDDGGG
jgi:hypothetical protein